MKRGLMVLLLFGACSSSSSCRVPTLEPTYLPHGLHSVAMTGLVDSARSRTWSDGKRVVQVLQDVQGNLGDTTITTKVRGYAAVVGQTGLDAAPLAVEWRDVCGASFAVLTKGLSQEEMLKIANGLR